MIRSPTLALLGVALFSGAPLLLMLVIYLTEPNIDRQASFGFTSGILTALFLGSIGAYVGTRQSKVAEKTREFDHERSRRVLSIELMQFYVKQVSTFHHHHWALRKLFETIDKVQAETIWRRQKLSIPLRYKELIEVILDHDVDISEEEEVLTLSQIEVAEIASGANHFLNVLEVIACAYNAQIIDPAIFHTEFRSIFLQDVNRFAFEDYMSISPAYPSLKVMLNEFKKGQWVVPNKDILN